tara:strand:- start:1144 stop:1851 length:708 start_codon:yes stop_codon:yes gene_type:complete
MTSILTVLNGKKYGVDCVNKLYNKLKENTKHPFNFYCYTDYQTKFQKGINIISITNKDKKLQWYKLDFFKKNFILDEYIIVMDIDMDILGNVDFLFEDIKNNEFRGTHRFWWRWREDKQKKEFALSGSVYKFINGEHQYIVDEFEKDILHWEEYFIKNRITTGPVNGEQHFVQMMLEKKCLKITMFPEKHIIKWNKDDFYIQTFIEHNYNKYSGNSYLFNDTFHPDVRIVHYAGN